MGIQPDLRDAIEEGRDEVVRVLAEYRVVPVVAEYESSNLLGGSQTPDFTFERQYESETEHVADRQTRQLAVDTLELRSEEECEDVEAEIRNHDSWGAKA